MSTPSPSAKDQVLADLAAESEQLEGWVRSLDDDAWSTVTTAEGWTVTHQVGHLMWTDRTSLAAIAGGEEWELLLRLAEKDPTGFIDTETARMAELPPESMLHHWRDSRQRLADALSAVPGGTKIPWFGPPMSATSLATARLMETWAHSRDVAEAVGIEAPQDDRCKHVCHLGVRTRGFAYLTRGLAVPDVEVYVELVGPSGAVWTWGSPDAPERVTGSGYDFALLATRRRLPSDVDVHAEGEHAQEWLGIVQAFAGSPGTDPRPR